MEHIDESSPLYFYRNKQNECTAGIAEISRRIYGISIARVVLALFFIAWLIWLGLVYGNRRVDNCRRNGRRFSIFD